MSLNCLLPKLLDISHKLAIFKIYSNAIEKLTTDMGCGECVYDFNVFDDIAYISCVFENELTNAKCKLMHHELNNMLIDVKLTCANKGWTMIIYINN